jgi:hypothetical protein
VSHGSFLLWALIEQPMLHWKGKGRCDYDHILKNNWGKMRYFFTGCDLNHAMRDWQAGKEVHYAVRRVGCDASTGSGQVPPSKFQWATLSGGSESALNL